MNGGTMNYKKIFPGLIISVSTLALLTGCDPATSTCGSNAVVTTMMGKIRNSFTFASMELLELVVNGAKGPDGQDHLHRKMEIDAVRTENYDPANRTANCTATFHYQVAPKGDENAPMSSWDNVDMRIRYTVRLADDGSFIINEDDWDYIK